MNNQYNNYNNGYNNYNNGYNNNYNNGYNYNYNNWNQPPMPPMNNNNDDDSNKGGGIISFILALLILIVAVAFLLHLLGVVDLKELYNKYILKEETKEVVDTPTKPEEKEEDKDEITEETKKELDNYCTFVDESGNYKIEDNQNMICLDNVCMLQVKDNIYAKNCKTNEYGKKTVDEFTKALQREVILNTLCTNIDANGNYTNTDENNEYEVSCNNFTCTAKIDGVDYSKNCQEQQEPTE